MPVTDTIAWPPKHKIGLTCVAVATNCVGCVIKIDEVEVQPLASETVKNEFPATTLNVPIPA